MYPPRLCVMCFTEAECKTFQSFMKNRLATKELMQDLHLSSAGVKYHKRNLLRKFGVATIAELLAWILVNVQSRRRLICAPVNVYKLDPHRKRHPGWVLQKRREYGKLATRKWREKHKEEENKRQKERYELNKLDHKFLERRRASRRKQYRRRLGLPVNVELPKGRYHVVAGKQFGKPKEDIGRVPGG